jgi:hypothetical protein
MKNFVKENWYKLMIGSSMMMISFGFMIYAISPSYANTNEEKINTSINSPNSNDDVFAVSSNGYVYVFESRDYMFAWVRGDKHFNELPRFKWIGNELWETYENDTEGKKIICYKTKLP